LRDCDGQQAVLSGSERFQHDLHWLFYEYFQGDNGAGVGASYQTGWTGLIAKLIQQGQHHTVPAIETVVATA
jgi:hypothetical protein